MNITDKINAFIHDSNNYSHMTKDIYDKLSKSINFIQVNNISIMYENNQEYTNPSIYLKYDNHDIVGKFVIEQFHNDGSKSMSIFVEEGYNDQNLSRLMIVSMLYVLKTYYRDTNDSLLLAIDTDASNGFWNYIGMVDNRQIASNSNRNIPIVGYEKIITLKELSWWGLGYNIFSYKGGKTSKRKTSKSKRKTSKRKTNKRKQRNRNK